MIQNTETKIEKITSKDGFVENNHTPNATLVKGRAR
jgi:hypothetical protein